MAEGRDKKISFAVVIDLQILFLRVGFQLSNEFVRIESLEVGVLALMRGKSIEKLE